MNKLATHRAQTPYMLFVLALMAGIAIALFLPVSRFGYYFVLLVLVLAIVSFLGLAFISKWQNYRLFDMGGLVFVVVLICVGFVLTWKDHPAINRQHFSRFKASYLLGYISREPIERGTFLTAEVRLVAVKEGVYKRAGGTLLLRINQQEDTVSLSYGDELLFKNRARQISPPHNPQEFDYAKYMANRNVWHQAYLSSADFVKTGNKKGSKLVGFALALRSEMIAKFHRYFKDQDAVALLSTLVLGYRAALDQELMQAFTATGTVHVLAVSGMHVGIVFAFLALGLKWMERKPYLAIVRLFILLFFIWSYALLTGFSASVLRAAFMISFLIGGNTFKKKRNTYNNLAASAFFLLLFNPKYLTEIGFQLSYLAVLGMVWLMPKVNALLTSVHKHLQKGIQCVAVSCTAQLTTYPLVLYYFHVFPVYFLPANLFIIVPVTLIIYGGFILLALPVNSFTLMVATYLEKLIFLMNKLLLTIEHWPFAKVKSIWIGQLEYIMLYLLLITAVFAFQYAARKFFYTMLVCLLCLGTMHGARIWYKHTNRRMVIFNVRNHVAIALLMENEAVLYSDFSSLDDAVVQYSVIPAIEAQSTIKHLTFIPQPAKSGEKDFSINRNHIQFMGKDLLIIDGTERTSTEHVEPDWVLLKDNPKDSLSRFMPLRDKPPLVILDATNTPHTIARYRSEAANLGIAIYCLKDNFAYVWDAKK